MFLSWPDQHPPAVQPDSYAMAPSDQPPIRQAPFALHLQTHIESSQPNLGVCPHLRYSSMRTRHRHRSHRRGPATCHLADTNECQKIRRRGPLARHTRRLLPYLFTVQWRAAGTEHVVGRLLLARKPSGTICMEENGAMWHDQNNRCAKLPRALAGFHYRRHPLRGLFWGFTAWLQAV